MSRVLTRLALEGGRIAVHSYQDVEDIVERNKALQSEPQRSDWGRHVATIPNNILLIWLNEEWARGNTTLKLFGPEFDALVERKLRDPDWRFLRTD
jgi:hypothetical protein